MDEQLDFGAEVRRQRPSAVAREQLLVAAANCERRQRLHIGPAIGDKVCRRSRAATSSSWGRR
jgi:hypothetical protein